MTADDAVILSADGIVERYGTVGVGPLGTVLHRPSGPRLQAFIAGTRR